MCVSIGEVSRGNENHRCARHVDTEGGRWSRCGRREREGGGVGYLGRVVAGLPGGNTRTILWSPREISATHSRVGPSRAVTLWLTACLFGEPTLPTLDRCYSLSLSLLLFLFSSSLAREGFSKWWVDFVPLAPVKCEISGEGFDFSFEQLVRYPRSSSFRFCCIVIRHHIALPLFCSHICFLLSLSLSLFLPAGVPLSVEEVGSSNYR